VSFDATFLLLGKEGVRGQFGAIFADDRAGKAPDLCNRSSSRATRIPDSELLTTKARRSPREVSDQRQDAEAAAVRYPRTLKLYVGSVM